MNTAEFWLPLIHKAHETLRDEFAQRPGHRASCVAFEDGSIADGTFCKLQLDLEPDAADRSVVTIHYTIEDGLTNTRASAQMYAVPDTIEFDDATERKWSETMALTWEDMQH